MACRFRAAAMLSVVMLLTDSPASAKDSTEMRTEFGPIAVVAEVPAFCVINNGPSTADAVCDPDGDGEAVRNTSVSTSLYFEITVQAFAGHQSPLALAQAYTFADFQKDLPGAICGEERLSRVRVEQPQRQMGETTVTYSATVTCPEVKFLSLDRRRARQYHGANSGRQLRS